MEDFRFLKYPCLHNDTIICLHKPLHTNINICGIHRGKMYGIGQTAICGILVGYHVWPSLGRHLWDYWGYLEPSCGNHIWDSCWTPWNKMYHLLLGIK